MEVVMSAVFEEKVRSRPMALLGVILSVFCLVLAVVTLLGEQPLTALLPIGGGVMLGGVLWQFSEIQIKIDDGGVHANFRGWFNRSIPFSEIRAVEARRYRFAEFWGWGLRFNFKGGLAYSLIGVPGSLRVYYGGQKKYFVVSSRLHENAVDIIRERIAPT
jgi:hypothetical protein